MSKHDLHHQPETYELQFFVAAASEDQHERPSGSAQPLEATNTTTNGWTVEKARAELRSHQLQALLCRVNPWSSKIEKMYYNMAIKKLHEYITSCEEAQQLLTTKHVNKR